MKTTFERYGEYVTWHIEDVETYEKVKKGISKWAETIYPRITHIRIPKKVFERLLELDKRRQRMSKEQINEMAFDICKGRGVSDGKDGGCLKCWQRGDCIYHEIADSLYNAGYRKQSGWISVEERLPEVAGRKYLVWDDVQATVKKRYFFRIHPNIPIETYPYIREYFGNASDYKRYTHWMPLPEPPRMKGGE